MNNIGERISKLIDNKQYADAISISESIGPFVGFSEQIRRIAYRRDNLAIDLAYNTINDYQYEDFSTKLMGELKSLFKNFPDNVVHPAVSDVLLDMFPVKTATSCYEAEKRKERYAEDLLFVKDKLAVVTRSHLGPVVEQPSNFDLIAEVLLNALRIRNMDVTDNNFYCVFNKFLETYFTKPKNYKHR